MVVLLVAILLSITLQTHSGESLFFTKPDVVNNPFTGWGGHHFKGTCPLNPPAPEGGSREVQEKNHRPTTVSLKLSCESGYQLVGEPNFNCRWGIWSPRKPHCKLDLRACKLKLSVAPDFGFVDIIEGINQLTARYTCETGYKLVGESNLTCGHTNNRPSCFLNMTSKVCMFGTPSSTCQYMTDSTKPNKWKLEIEVCEENKLHRWFKPIPAVHLRYSTAGDSEVLKAITDLFSKLNISNLHELTRVFDDFFTSGTHPFSVNSRGSQSPSKIVNKHIPDFHTFVKNLPGTTEQTPTPVSENDSASCQTGETVQSAILKLEPYSRVERATERNQLNGTLQVGSFTIASARYIKFNIEGPSNANWYVLHIGGHCLPDPPGDYYPVHTIVIQSPTQDGINRDFCFNLHSRVRCSRNAFDFLVRIQLVAIFNKDAAEGAIRLTPKGVSQTMCSGFAVEDNP